MKILLCSCWVRVVSIYFLCTRSWIWYIILHTGIIMTLSGSYTQAFSFSDVTHLEQRCTDKSMELILKKIESKTYSQRYRIFLYILWSKWKKEMREIQAESRHGYLSWNIEKKRSGLQQWNRKFTTTNMLTITERPDAELPTNESAWLLMYTDEYAARLLMEACYVQCHF